MSEGSDHGKGEHASLARRRAAVLPSWLDTLYSEPIDIESGSGRHVRDAEGNSYLDFFGGILTTMTGHAVPEVTEAVAAQAGRILHSSTLYLNRPMVELAERIAELSGIEDPRVFFTTSGTEANDTALLLATAHRCSNQILALRNSYHGRSFSSLSVTGNRAWSPSSLSPVQTSYVHGSRRRGTPFAGLDDAEFTAACVNDLEDVLAQLHGNVACLIAEPIQGVGGFTAPPDGMLARFKEVLDRHGILWISDEVQTGWGRTGEHFWGWQAHADNGPPDMITFAKGIGNGLPIAGVVARAEVMESLEGNSISTFGGSPLTAAGALANLEHHLRNDLRGNAREVGAVLRAELSEAEALPAVGEIRGRGLMLGVELLRSDGSPAPELAAETTEQARARGLLIGKGGLEGNVLRIAPPLSLTEQEARQGARVLLEALRVSC
ncbi:aspartate aminotransferase family protein [Actinopolyspora mortivallis]|uniref:aspartate aminotransferase family protein n=1 Tax=Actinopolyspora mortivallis TaxID=33906 RepID=UPI00037DBF44|nr:aspartate aminotransferase family protein [Actinopolyspora mortivallis]